MSVLIAIAWFVSYLFAYISFVYWGWQWSQEIATAQATAVWFLLSVVLGWVGVWVVSLALKEKG